MGPMMILFQRDWSIKAGEVLLKLYKTLLRHLNHWALFHFNALLETQQFCLNPQMCYHINIPTLITQSLSLYSVNTDAKYLYSN